MDATDLSELTEEDTSALKLRIKKLSKKLRNEKKARTELESKYNALVEAFHNLENAFVKVKELITAYEQERQQREDKSKFNQNPLLQGLDVPPPPQPQKIDNTTSNREFVSPEEAKKEVDDWLRIFGKK
jgi:ribosome-binding ATPase YchF (GTP1/OBG family)